MIGNPLINEIIIFDRNIKKKNLFQKCCMELSFLRGIRAKGFDMTVNLTSGDRGAIVSFASKAKYRLAYEPGKKGLWGKRYLYTHLANNKMGQHAVLKNLDVLRQFGIDTSDITLDFFIPEDAKSFVRKVFLHYDVQETDTVVHAHPTSRWFF